MKGLLDLRKELMIEGVLGCVSQIGVRFLKFFGVRGLAARDFGLRRILQGFYIFSVSYRIVMRAGREFTGSKGLCRFVAWPGAVGIRSGFGVGLLSG